MRSKHAFKPASLDRLESREVLSTLNPALIPSGSGRNALGGPTGFTGQFNGAGRTFADSSAIAPNGSVNSGTGFNAFGGPTGFTGQFTGAGRTFADAGQVGGSNARNQFGGPTGFNGRFNGFGNAFTDRRVGVAFNNGLGTNGSAFANNNFGASSGLMFNNGLGSSNVRNVNPFNRFAGQNGFSPANGLNVNNSNGFATGNVTGANGRTFFIPGR